MNTPKALKDVIAGLTPGHQLAALLIDGDVHAAREICGARMVDAKEDAIVAVAIEIGNERRKIQSQYIQHAHGEPMPDVLAAYQRRIGLTKTDVPSGETP